LIVRVVLSRTRRYLVCETPNPNSLRWRLLANRVGF
jgi:hypothetical protein